MPSYERLFTETKDEWLTPPEIISSLGEFDLDPCSPINRPWDTAKNHYTIEDNGLEKKWYGRVWLNPPYGREISHWLNKMHLHKNGIALVFAKTDTKWFQTIWEHSSAIFFLKGRLSFYNVDGTLGNSNGGSASVLVAYGEENVNSLQNLNNDFHGSLVLNWNLK
ncbi:MAG: DNA N-6-adenine-methyltransferase [bacterium]